MKPNTRLVFLGIAATSMLAVSPAAMAAYNSVPYGGGSYPYYYGSDGPDMARVDLSQDTFINKFGFCRYVDNVDTEGDLMVPFATAEEWRAFRESNPEGSEIDHCCGWTVVSSPCGGSYSLNQLGRPGDTVEQTFGYSLTVRYTCGSTGPLSNPDTTANWSGQTISGQCEPPPPPPSSSGNGGDGQGNGVDVDGDGMADYSSFAEAEAAGYSGGRAVNNDPPAGGGGGGGGDSVICTELLRQGLMDAGLYAADDAFGKSLSPDVMRGYHFWGKPVARLMSESETATAVTHVLAKPWMSEMARQAGLEEEGSWLGRAYLAIGVPLNGELGKLISEN